MLNNDEKKIETIEQKLETAFSKIQLDLMNNFGNLMPSELLESGKIQLLKETFIQYIEQFIPQGEEARSDFNLAFQNLESVKTLRDVLHSVIATGQSESGAIDHLTNEHVRITSFELFMNQAQTSQEQDWQAKTSQKKILRETTYQRVINNHPQWNRDAIEYTLKQFNITSSVEEVEAAYLANMGNPDWQKALRQVIRAKDEVQYIEKLGLLRNAPSESEGICNSVRTDEGMDDPMCDYQQIQDNIVSLEKALIDNSVLKEKTRTLEKSLKGLNSYRLFQKYGTLHSFILTTYRWVTRPTFSQYSVVPQKEKAYQKIQQLLRMTVEKGTSDDFRSNLLTVFAEVYPERYSQDLTMTSQQDDLQRELNELGFFQLADVMKSSDSISLGIIESEWQKHADLNDLRKLCSEFHETMSDLKKSAQKSVHGQNAGRSDLSRQEISKVLPQVVSQISAIQEEQKEFEQSMQALEKINSDLSKNAERTPDDLNGFIERIGSIVSSYQGKLALETQETNRIAKIDAEIQEISETLESAGITREKKLYTQQEIDTLSKRKTTLEAERKNVEKFGQIISHEKAHLNQAIQNYQEPLQSQNLENTYQRLYQAQNLIQRVFELKTAEKLNAANIYSSEIQKNYFEEEKNTVQSQMVKMNEDMIQLDAYSDLAFYGGVVADYITEHGSNFKPVLMSAVHEKNQIRSEISQIESAIKNEKTAEAQNMLRLRKDALEKRLHLNTQVIAKSFLKAYNSSIQGADGQPLIDHKHDHKHLFHDVRTKADEDQFDHLLKDIFLTEEKSIPEWTKLANNQRSQSHMGSSTAVSSDLEETKKHLLSLINHQRKCDQKIRKLKKAHHHYGQWLTEKIHTESLIQGLLKDQNTLSDVKEYFQSIQSHQNHEDQWIALNEKQSELDKSLQSVNESRMNPILNALNLSTKGSIDSAIAKNKTEIARLKSEIDKTDEAINTFEVKNASLMKYAEEIDSKAGDQFLSKQVPAIDLNKIRSSFQNPQNAQIDQEDRAAFLESIKREIKSIKDSKKAPVGRPNNSYLEPQVKGFMEVAIDFEVLKDFDRQFKDFLHTYQNYIWNIQDEEIAKAFEEIFQEKVQKWATRREALIQNAINVYTDKNLRDRIEEHVKTHHGFKATSLLQYSKMTIDGTQVKSSQLQPEEKSSFAYRVRSFFWKCAVFFDYLIGSAYRMLRQMKAEYQSQQKINVENQQKKITAALNQYDPQPSETAEVGLHRAGSLLLSSSKKDTSNRASTPKKD